MLLSKTRASMENLKPYGLGLSKSLKYSQITHIDYRIWRVKKFSTAQ
jgi:hypothetical protein